MWVFVFTGVLSSRKDALCDVWVWLDGGDGSRTRARVTSVRHSDESNCVDTEADELAADNESTTGVLAAVETDDFSADMTLCLFSNRKLHVMISNGSTCQLMHQCTIS